MSINQDFIEVVDANLFSRKLTFPEEKPNNNAEAMETRKFFTSISSYLGWVDVFFRGGNCERS